MAAGYTWPSGFNNSFALLSIYLTREVLDPLLCENFLFTLSHSRLYCIWGQWSWQSSTHIVPLRYANSPWGHITTYIDYKSVFKIDFLDISCCISARFIHALTACTSTDVTLRHLLLLEYLLKCCVSSITIGGFKWCTNESHNPIR